MASSYGTTEIGQKEQLSGYFDVNNESVSIKKGKASKVWDSWSKKKKICVVVTILFIILMIIVVAIAASATTQSSSSKRGVISSLKSGTGCKGESDKQNRCERTGECIEKVFICDGYKDCQDGDDEIASLCTELKKQPPCLGSKFQCHSSRKCLEPKLRCDGKYDCGDHDFSDERNCFSIDPETSRVFVYKYGLKYPMTRFVDYKVAELICQELGFKSLRYPPDHQSSKLSRPEEHKVAQNCWAVNQKFEPDRAVLIAEDELVNNIDLISNCRGGTLDLVCSHDDCGVFGEFTGPVVPKSWVNAQRAKLLKDSTVPFPWVVDIFKGKDLQCKGTIVDSEWVLTSLNCISDDIFYARDRVWRVVAAGGTDFPQERDVSKVMKNHFEEMLNRSPADNIVAVQVYPAFELNGFSHQICLRQPAVLPHFNCFVATDDNGGQKHVRVVPKNGTENCGGSDHQNNTLCFSYPHAEDKKSCLNAKGGPVSCLDPATNSWTFSGIATAKIGCGKEEWLAASMSDPFNFNWASIITSPPQFLGDKCGGTAPFRAIRFWRGSRQGEVYMDVAGWGEYQQWHTVYEFSTALKIISQPLPDAKYSPKVLIANNTGITSRNVAFLTCPEKEISLCKCKVEYRPYAVTLGEAKSMHFLTDIDGDGDVDYADTKFQNWNNDINLEQLREGFYNNRQDQIGASDILGESCPNKTNARFCNSSMSDTCIPVDFICDGNIDCPASVDENRDLCQKYYGYTCPPKWFQCKTTYDCVPFRSRCDGKSDCIDGSDERQCVKVMGNDSIVLIERKGLTLPLTGLPSEVATGTLINLAIDLCEAMGFGQHNQLQTYAARSRQFSLGCYKLRVERKSGSYLVHNDFSRHERGDCHSLLGLTCRPPKCGTSGTLYRGPKRPASWPTPTKSENNTKNHDYPWLVHLVQNDVIICGATIIHPSWVVTSFDCVQNFTSDLKVVFLDMEGKKKEHKVTLKANFYSTHRSARNADLVQRNVMMLGVHEDFDMTSQSHPLCLRPPLYVPQSLCLVSGHVHGDLKHMRVMPRPSGRCEEAGVLMSDAPADQQCVELVDVDNPDICANTHGSALQCLDKLRNQWTFAAIMNHDIGRGCDRASGTFAVATVTRIIVPWVIEMVDDVERRLNITCSGGDNVHQLIFRKTNYDDEWYMITSAGLAVTWEDDDTLKYLASPLVRVFGADRIADAGSSNNITALNHVTLSKCEETCDCAPETAGEQGVSKFYLLRANQAIERNRDESYKDENGIIENQGKPANKEFDIVTRKDPTVTDNPTRPH